LRRSIDDGGMLLSTLKRNLGNVEDRARLGVVDLYWPREGNPALTEDRSSWRCEISTAQV
jgi:hypothetical protein